MKLDKKDRQKLYEAKGKTISLVWPQDAPDPRKGKRYAIYGDSGEKLFSIRVERSKRLSYETRVTIRLDNDPIRVMPGLSGIRTPEGDYEDEPERVHEDYEKLLSEEGWLKTRCLRAEHTGSGKLAQEFASREKKRLEAA